MELLEEWGLAGVKPHYSLKTRDIQSSLPLLAENNSVLYVIDVKKKKKKNTNKSQIR